MKGPLKLILMRSQKKKRERERGGCTEIYRLLREYINHHEQNVGRNSGSKGHSDRNEEDAIGNRAKAIPVTKWPRNWLNCVLVFV